jgi:hypothetical protein
VNLRALLRRAKAAQRLQGCDCLCGGRLAVVASRFDLVSDIRSAAVGDESLRRRDCAGLSGRACHRIKEPMHPRRLEKNANITLKIGAAPAGGFHYGGRVRTPSHN